MAPGNGRRRRRTPEQLVAELEARIRELQERVTTRKERERGVAAQKPVRFSPSWVARHRQKLGLSAANYARLVGVSGLTIYNWEKGKVTPRAKQVGALREVLPIGKREARERLSLGATGRRRSKKA